MHDILMPYVERGLLTRREHPEYPYSIYNYTEACAFGHEWDDVTRKARGLILDADGKIVARGMDKFFNYGEQDADYIDLMDHVRVCDKMDGSLGIIYRTPDDGWAVATRGSFTSEQAIHATALLNSNPDALTFLTNEFKTTTNNVFLVEIIYPENRIVLDYGDQDRLPLLGWVNLYDNGFHPATNEPSWPWGAAGWLGDMSFKEALELPDRKNAEGIVVNGYGDTRVKIKQEDYVALHRIVTNLNERTVWEQLATGQDIWRFARELPEEFEKWVYTTANAIEAKFVARRAFLEEEFTRVIDILDHDYTPDGWERKDFAIEVGRSVNALDKWAMFAMLDDKTLDDKVWKEVRP